MNKLTAEQRRRVEQALAETITCIEKEEARGPKNRPEYMQKLLPVWHQHIIKLQQMLAA